MKYTKCKICGKMISNNNIKRHEATCGLDKKRKAMNIQQYKIGENKYKCPHCGKVYSEKGIGTHIWRTHGDGINHNSHKNYIKCSKTSWNKGLSNETDNRVKEISRKNSILLQEKVKNGTYIPIVQTEEMRQNTSKRMSESNPGGRCKWYEINGIKVQGTWELNIAKILNKLQIEWTRPNSFNYIRDNRLTYYTPDFYIPKYNCYLEVKGFWWGNDKEKMDIFMSQYPDMNIKIIEKQLYNDILKNKNNLLDLFSR